MKKLSSFFATCLMAVIFLIGNPLTVYAEPNNYLDEIIDGINNAADEFVNGLIGEETTEVTESYTQPTEVYEEPTASTEPATEDNPYNEDTTNSIISDIYEEATQSQTEYIEDNNSADDYYYMIVTEPETEYYEPEILTETYTDAPFLERLAITDTSEGNVFIALALWGSIVVGIIVVLSIVISTHRRKKG